MCAGLRKTNPGSADGAAAGPPAAETAKAPRDAKAAAKKRKSVRFNIPAEGERLTTCRVQSVRLSPGRHQNIIGSRRLPVPDSDVCVNNCQLLEILCWLQGLKWTE